MTNASKVRFTPPLNQDGNPYPRYLELFLASLSEEPVDNFTKELIYLCLVDHVKETGLVYTEGGLPDLLHLSRKKPTPNQKVEHEILYHIFKKAKGRPGFPAHPGHYLRPHLIAYHAIGTVLKQHGLVKGRIRTVDKEFFTEPESIAAGFSFLFGGAVTVGADTIFQASAESLGNSIGLGTVGIGLTVLLPLHIVNNLSSHLNPKTYKLTSAGTELNEELQQYRKVVDASEKGAKYLTGLSEDNSGMPETPETGVFLPDNVEVSKMFSWLKRRKNTA